jgi:DNA polymerase/3'-5' exonuclease PolX
MGTDPIARGLATLLWRLADLVQVAETRRSFRAKAYRAAVWALDDLPTLEASDDIILATPGIGPGVKALIRQYSETGRLNQLIPLEQAYPLEAARLRRLPRMTPRILRDLKVE